MFTKTCSCIECIQRTICFENLSDKELMKIEEGLVNISYAPNEIIVKQGAFASNIYFIKEGMVKVYLENDNKKLILRLSKTGQLLGLEDLFADGLSSFTIAAVVPTSICIINFDDFKKIIQTNSRFSATVIKEITENNRKVLEKLCCFANKQLSSRIAEILIYLSEKIYNSDEFNISVSRQEMAEMTNMAVENVIRELTKLKQRGIISISGKNIQIHDKKALFKQI